MFNSIRKGLSIRRAKVDSVFGFSTGISDKEKDFHFTSTGVEGHLKVPKDGRIQKGWTKKHVVIKDYQLYIFEKEKDKERASQSDIVIDLRWSLFLCKEGNETTVKDKKEDMSIIFTIQAKAVTPAPSGQKGVDVSSSC